MTSLRLFLAIWLVSVGAYAETEGIFRGVGLEKISLAESLADIQPGSVVIIGENHGLSPHKNQQMAILRGLKAQGLKVSVGLEFFTYTDQDLVNSYREGLLPEEDFLGAIGWSGTSFDFYREQALFPNLQLGERTLALNAPRSLTGKVARLGFDSLNAEELAILPPQFTQGRESYRRRFLSMMPHLPSPEAGARYFAAQSIWDDTMAWRAEQFVSAHPDQVLVIVVGDFHVQYGGGLPDRVRARLPHTPVWTFSQINTNGLTDEELMTEVSPSEKDGPRADFLWLAPVKSPGL